MDGRGLAHLGRQADHVQDVPQVGGEAADRPGQHGVGLAARQHDGGDHGAAGADELARGLGGDAAAAHAVQVEGDVVVVARVAVGVHQLEVAARPDVEAEPPDPALDHLRAADQDRPRQPLLEHDLDGAQDPLLLAVGVDEPLRRASGLLEQGAHDEAGAEDALLQAPAVGGGIGERTGGDAAVHRGLGDRRRQLDDQARVEGLGDQVLRPEHQVLEPVGRGHRLGRRRAGEAGQRLDAGDLHRLVDRGGADVQGTAEDEGEAEDVVDLVRVVAPPRREDRVRPDGAGRLGHDLRRGVGERQDQRARRHDGQHLGLQHVRGGEAEEDVGAQERVGERAGVGPPGVAGLVGVHLLGRGPRRPRRRCR